MRTESNVRKMRTHDRRGRQGNVWRDARRRREAYREMWLRKLREQEATR